MAIAADLLVDVVVDVANSPSFEDQAAMDFFQTAGRNLTAAEVSTGVRHHLALSVVGTERLQDSSYFRAKLAQERLIKSSPIPYTLIHATQFYEFVRAIAQFSTEGDTVRLPPVLFQPSGRGRGERGRRGGACRAGERHKVIADPEAPYFGVKVSEKTLVPGAGARLGSTRFDWWLTHVPPPPSR